LEDFVKHVIEGQTVVYCDHVGVEHDALVTAVWGENSFEDGSGPALNVVYVTNDDTKTDSYGRQIERDTSVIHHDGQPAPGNWWKLKGE